MREPIPSPQEVGLPENYETWRTNQAEAIRLGLYGTKRAEAICAPTGFGKQAVALAIAVLSKKPTCIVTATRGLQDQYAKVGASLGLVDLRGRNNYSCHMRPDENYTCEDGYSGRCIYKGTVACPSSQAEMRAAVSPLVCTNYDKWTSTKSFGIGMSHFQQVIFDEGHEAPDALSRAMQVTLHHREIEDKLGIDFLEGSDAEEFKPWKTWAAGARAIAEDEMVKARSLVLSTLNPKTKDVRHYNHMKQLVKRLSILSTAAAKNWVVEQKDQGYQFDPIRPGQYAEPNLLLKIPRLIFLSANLRPKTMYMSGLGKASFDFHDFPSEFDPNRSPIYYVPTMRVEYGADLRPLWVKLDQIASKRRDRKGIIHTISYARRDDIMATSRFADWMIFNSKGEPPTDMVESFKLSPPGTMLVSPSVGTGYDFPDDECRWQMVCKVPFEPPSKIQKARQAEDKEYVYYRAMQYLVQAFGRDMRSKTDWSERFICDDHIEWFMSRYGHLAPSSFHRVFKRANILPQPLMINN